MNPSIAFNKSPKQILQARGYERLAPCIAARILQYVYSSRQVRKSSCDRLLLLEVQHRELDWIVQPDLSIHTLTKYAETQSRSAAQFHCKTQYREANLGSHPQGNSCSLRGSFIAPKPIVPSATIFTQTSPSIPNYLPVLELNPDADFENFSLFCFAKC